MKEKTLVLNKKDHFLLMLNKKTYDLKIVRDSVKDEAWVEMTKGKGEYFYLKMNTLDREKVLDMANSILYHHRTG